MRLVVCPQSAAVHSVNTISVNTRITLFSRHHCVEHYRSTIPNRRLIRLILTYHEKERRKKIPCLYKGRKPEATPEVSVW